MEIKIFNQGIFNATTYLCFDSVSKDAVMVDCTCCIDEIKSFILENKLKLKYILITHGHFDHVYCLKDAKEAFPMVPVLLHKDDSDLLSQVKLQCNMAGFDDIEVPCIDKFIDEDEDISLGGDKIKVIHTKGHSKGGVCYLINDVVFSGDTLFSGSIGRCDLYGGSYPDIRKSIAEKLFTLPKNTKVYPGHGESTTIEKEMRTNPYFISA